MKFLFQWPPKNFHYKKGRLTLLEVDHSYMDFISTEWWTSNYGLAMVDKWADWNDFLTSIHQSA